ncbi:hypothetical protein [Afipia sp. P52-10]|uniref:hypothetical protein n=1 Tax=Afipia sp. P52-10 TaxID=1429916 RepID=UPI001267DF8E|nr:hypothetical protein [Afipia sp. P52-10]
MRISAAASFAAVLLPLALMLPALWNGFPLLQYDTGGYIARWYEGYLVPSRSTTFGLYLHLGEDSHFWLNLKLQALATIWILQAVLRVYDVARLAQIITVVVVLALTTALPWLVSLLLTDIFAGLSVLSLFLLVLHGERVSRLERGALFLFTAFAAASHSATLAVLLGLVGCAVLARRWLARALPLKGIVHGGLALLAGAAMLLATNLMMSGRLAWTPGAYGIAFSRILQDGIVARYLNDHCAREALKLCPYRNDLPATGDMFLWGKSVFNQLGRFEGMNDEMRDIVLRSLIAYPGQHLSTAAAAAIKQLTMVATGEGVHSDLMHTHRIIERYLPQQALVMQTSRQHRGDLSFTEINRIHVPAALASLLLIAALTAYALWRRTFDDIALLCVTTLLAVLGNAAVCAVLSGPHDRYGSRLAWIATFTALVAFLRSYQARAGALDHALLVRNASTPSL